VFPHTGLLFEDRVDIAVHIGGSNPQKRHFGAWIGIFKPNSEKLKLAYYRSHCIDSNQILQSDKFQQMRFVGSFNTHTTNPIWPTAAILKN